MRGQDIQLLAVFCDGPAGDLDALFIEGLHEELVGKRLGGVFRGDDLLDGLTDAGIGNLGAVAGLVASGEEGAHFHESVGRENVFPGDGARNGGRVEAKLVGDVVHRKRAQVAVAADEEGWLVLDELVGDGEDGFLAQGNGVDEAAAIPDLVAEKLAGLRVGARFADHVLVEIVNAEIRQMFAGEAGIPVAVVVAFDDDIRQDVGVAGGIVFAAGVRCQAADPRGGLGDALPAGTVRVYMKDARGQPQFIGENTIGHTPMGSALGLKTGEAFDVKIKPVVEKREQISDTRWKTSMRYTLTNARSAPVVVDLTQAGLDGYYDDTRIVSESLKSERRSSDEAVWKVTVPANGETVVTVVFDTRY